MIDITSGIKPVFDLLFKGLKWCFDFLDSISFNGISLLDFCIWVFVLGIVLPIILTLLNAGRSATESYYGRKKSEARSEERYQRRKAERAAERNKK